MSDLGNKIMVIGCCGAGKSTLARHLGKKLNLPVIHLDQQYFSANWTEPSAEEWAPKVQALASGDQWIIDGNYGGTMDIRLKKVDTIVFLHFSRWLCLYRVLKRIVKYHGKVRPDMQADCRERFDLSFLHYVLMFNTIKAPRIIKQLKNLPPEKQVFQINSPKALEKWLKAVS